MNFEVFGPFHLTVRADRTIDKGKFWRDVSQAQPELENARGCYIFVVSIGNIEKPWYVGKSQRQKFKDEIFRDHKLDIYDKSIPSPNVIGQVGIYLIAHRAQKGGFRRPGATPKTIAFVERMLIRMAYATNRELANRVDTKILRELNIPGLYTAKEGSIPSKQALALAKILGLPTRPAQIEAENAEPLAAECNERHLTVTLADGRVLQTPLWWYPRLLAATAEQRVRVEVSPLGIHWPEIAEDISVASILGGAKAPGAKEPVSMPS